MLVPSIFSVRQHNTIGGDFSGDFSGEREKKYAGTDGFAAFQHRLFYPAGPAPLSLY
jgi:hypothetical protein